MSLALWPPFSRKLSFVFGTSDSVLWSSRLNGKPQKQYNVTASPTCLFWAFYWKNATPLINNHLNCDSLGIIDLLGSEFSTRKKLDELILMAKLMFIVANACRLPSTASHLFSDWFGGLSVLKLWRRRCETCSVAYWLDLAVKKKIETWKERERQKE